MEPTFVHRVYRYATLMRPPTPGSIPKDGLLEVKDIEGVAPSGHRAHGWAEYDRKLTDAEINDYELEYVHSYPVYRQP